MMEEEPKKMRDGMEADLLSISVKLSDLLHRLESFVSLLHLKEIKNPSRLELRSLQKTLFILQDFVDVETSLETRVIDHIDLGTVNGLIFKDEQVSVAAEKSVKLPSWLREIRVALDEIILALERVYIQVSHSQAMGLKYFLDSYKDEEEEINPPTISSSKEDGRTIISLDIHGFTFPTKPEIVTKQRDDVHSHASILSCISPHSRQLANLIYHRSPPEPQRIETPQLTESFNDVYGREEDKLKVIELLVSDLGKSTISSSCHVVSIVGGPGVGKTTLGHLVYNDERVDNCFDMKIWVGMSNGYSDVIRTITSFIEAAKMSLETPVSQAPREETRDQEVVDGVVGESSYTSSSALALDPLVGEASVTDSNTSSVLAHHQSLLATLLQGKKNLLVLDGVSNQICCDWEVLGVPFRVGAKNGSKILITSRSRMVPSRLEAVHSYTLGPLPYGYCSSLIGNVIFERNGGTPKGPPLPPGINLSHNIEIMAKVLQGFPSLVVALGIFLHPIQTQEEKLNVACEVTSLTFVRVSRLRIPKIILWTYHSLSSPQLKQSFVFCGLFPKSYTFKKSKLIQLWMGEGFLNTMNATRMEMEDIGVSYLEELIEKSFFQNVWRSTHFQLPDDVHDFAQYIFTHRDLKIYIDSLRGKFYYDRHSILCSNTNGVGHQKYRFYNSFFSMEKCGQCINQVRQHLFVNLVGLRVLDLSYCGLSHLPDSIVYLEHLRFLDLSKSKIKYLPKSISMLQFLQTLKIKGIYDILEYPPKMERLVNLRHLNLGSGYLSFSMPLGIGKLTNLQSLRAFCVGTEDDEFGRIEELRELRFLRGSLTILNLENVEKDCKGGWLRDKILRKLRLKWNQMGDKNIAENLLANLHPHPSLKHLHIISYGGLRFSSWIGNPIFSSLQTIELKDCDRCEFLPPLGLLPCLESLYLSKMSALQHINGGFYGNKGFFSLKKNIRFPKLKMLTLYELHYLETWTGFEEGDMPLLEELDITNCHVLISLPNLKSLGSLRGLKFCDCEKLPMLPNKGLPSSLKCLYIDGCPLLEKSCKREEGKDWSKVKAVPDLTIGRISF